MFTLFSTLPSWALIGPYCESNITLLNGTIVQMSFIQTGTNDYQIVIVSSTYKITAVNGYAHTSGNWTYHYGAAGNYSISADGYTATIPFSSTSAPKLYNDIFIIFETIGEQKTGIFNENDISWSTPATCSLDPEPPCTPRTFKSGEKVYFKDQSSNFDFGALWKVSSGNVYAYFWNDTENAWSSYGTPVDGSWNDANTIYELTVPGTGKEYTHVLFTRGNAATFGSGLWDKTTDQEPCEGKNLFYVSKDKYADHIYEGDWGNLTPASKTVYFDARIAPDTWTTAYVRIGHGTNNSAWGPMTKVAGTKCLYSQTTSKWVSHTDFAIANKAGWTGSNHIDQPEKTYSNGSWDGSADKMTMQTNYQQYAIENDIYICPKATSVLEHGCQFYQVTNENSTTSSRIDANTAALALPQYTVTSVGTNCTVTLVQYTADDFSTSTALSSGGSVDPTRYVGVTVTPNAGYEFSSVSLTADAYVQHTAAAAGVTGKYAIMADCEITAVCTASTYTITYKDKGDVAFSGSHESGYPTTHTYGTSTTLKSATKSNFTFAGWYNNASCTGDPITTLGATAYTDNITLYAKWIASPSVNAGPSGYDACQISAIYTSGDEYSPTGIIEADWGVAALATYYTDGSGKKAYRIDTKSGYYYGLYAGSTWEGVPTTLTDITDYTKLHIEFWSAEAQTFNLSGMSYYSSANHDGTAQSVSTTAGTWTVREFNISDLGSAVTDHKDVFSGFKIDYGSGNTDKELVIANIYFIKDDAPCAVPINREDLDECRVLSVLGTTKYTPMGISEVRWDPATGAPLTIGDKGTNNVWHGTSTASETAFHLATESNVQAYNKIHLEVWTGEAMTFQFGQLCWVSGCNRDAGGAAYQKQTITTEAAQWKVLDYTLTDLTTFAYLEKACDLCFYGLDGKDIYITNVYYYNDDATKPVVTTASHGSVTGDELTLTLTGTYKGAALNTFRITNVTTSEVFDRITDGSNQTTIPGIRYCEAYTLNIQAVYHDCVLSDATELTVDAAAMSSGINIIPTEAVTATASHYEPGFEPNKAIDGIDNSYWGSHTWTSDEEWLNLDLGRILEISGFQVAWNNNAASNLYIEGSRDGINYYRLNHIKTAPTNYSLQPAPIAYETYALESHIRIRHIRLRVLNMTDETVIREIKVFGSCDAAYSDPVSSFALFESQEVNISNTGVDATLEVGAYDYETAYGDLYYQLSITPTGGSTTILDNQRATDGFIILTGLEFATEYTVVITARDGNNGNLADNSVTVVFTTLNIDPMACVREGGPGSGSSDNDGQKFTTGYLVNTFSDGVNLIIKAESKDSEAWNNAILHVYGGAGTGVENITDKTTEYYTVGGNTYHYFKFVIPLNDVRLTSHAINNIIRYCVKFEGDEGRIRITEYHYYDLSVPECAPDTWVIYHHGQKPTDSDIETFNGGQLVQPIEYRRKFDLDTWYTIYLPFDVTAVQVIDGDDYYDLKPYYRQSDGTIKSKNYIIRKANPVTNMPVEDVENKLPSVSSNGWFDPTKAEFDAGFLPQKNTPYLIQFHNAYYEDKWIAFFGQWYSTIDTEFATQTAPTTDEMLNIYGNNTMKNRTISSQCYQLNYEEYGGSAWTRFDNITLYPFECYILANSTTTAKYRILRRGAGEDDTTTDLEDVYEENGTVYVYTMAGQLLYTFNNVTPDEVGQQLQNRLMEGVYILRTVKNSYKLIIGGR